MATCFVIIVNLTPLFNENNFCDSTKLDNKTNMTNLQEVPTDELLSFQDNAPVHNTVTHDTLSNTQTNLGRDNSYKTSPKNMETLTDRASETGLHRKYG